MSLNGSIPVPETIAAVTAATNKGVVTVADNTLFYPGTLGWLSKTDGSAQKRVQIVQRVGTTQLTVRVVADGTETTKPAPSFGLSDVSAFNTASSLCVEAQVASVNMAHVAWNR